jgi:predicted nucleic acid-binding protein
MTRAVLADVGPLYALADGGDQYHSRALRESDRLRKQKRTVVVAYSTLAEGHSLILRRLGADYAQRWLAEALSTAGMITPTDRDYREAAQRVATYTDQAVSLADAVVAILSERLSIPVWTYDHHFEVMHVKLWR